jgi:hypothetical protein
MAIDDSDPSAGRATGRTVQTSVHARPVVLSSERAAWRPHNMLVPITDPENPYSKMMIELIAEQTPFPQSPLPRRRTDVVNASLTRRQRAGLAAVAGTFAVLAILITEGAIGGLQS